jgi:5-methylcytosine-specific restriction endonuclease McrA
MPNYKKLEAIKRKHFAGIDREIARKKQASEPKPPKKKRPKSRWKYRRPKELSQRPDYAEYLRSKTWRGVRRWKLERAGWKCERCGSTRQLQAHHKHYRSLGRERLDDLEVLCESCHKHHHHVLADAHAHLAAIQRQTL